MMNKTLIVDVSHHQLTSNINWAKAAEEVALMIIRVQYGSTVIDREYVKHVHNCKKYGIPFAHYAYARFVSENDAIVEARDFLNRIDPAAKFLVVDVEDKTTPTVAQMKPATQAFIDVCKASGWKVGLYTGHHLYKPFGMDKVNADFLWLPRYGSNDGTQQKKPDYPCEIWQYTSKGKVSWYNGNLDLNTLNGSKSLAWFIGEDEEPVEKKDYEGHWAENSIRKAMNKGVLTANSEGNFRVNEHVTRAQLATVLDRLKLLE